VAGFFKPLAGALRRHERPSVQAKDDEESKRSPLAPYLKYSHVGLQFFLSIGLFTGAGILLDKRLETLPLFTLVGLVLGFGGGLYSLYREFVLRRETRPKSGPGRSKSPSEPS